MISVAMTAAAPRSEPAKSQDFLPRAKPRRARSAAWLVRQIRPSSMKRANRFQRRHLNGRHQPSAAKKALRCSGCKGVMALSTAACWSYVNRHDYDLHRDIAAIYSRRLGFCEQRRLRLEPSLQAPPLVERS